MTCRFESAPAALPAQSEGCGGAENEKALIDFEALNMKKLARQPAYCVVTLARSRQVITRMTL